jgi:hypothetical protein
LVDTVIDFCKRADDISHFSKVVMEKYGHPKWDLTLTLNNENGLKSLMVPVADTSNQVKLIIFAYQDTKDHVIFKFVGRNTPQPGLPLATNSGKTLTKESLVGIFNALDKRVAASKIQPNSSMENIKSNSYISSLCWLITWHYADGSVGVLNSQCSYQIIITPGNAKGGLADGQIGVVEDIQIGDGGGGGEQDPCANAEQDALNQLKLQFDEQKEYKTPITQPINATQIDLNPYHEIKNWTIVEGSINHWKVTATTVIDLSYDNFPVSYNRTLSLQSLGSQYEGSNNLITSTWTPSSPVIRINSNHTRFPSGSVTESGSLNHRMKGQLKVNTPCGEFTFSPGFEDSRRHTGTLTIITQ